MTVTEKIKTIDNKTEQNEAQYNLERQTAETSALLSGNVGKYEFLIGKIFYQKKKLLQKNLQQSKGLNIHH